MLERRGGEVRDLALDHSFDAPGATAFVPGLRGDQGGDLGPVHGDGPVTTRTFDATGRLPVSWRGYVPTTTAPGLDRSGLT